MACITPAQTPTLIQHVSGSGTLHGLVSSGGSYNLPLPNATLAGNAMICAFQLDSTGPPALSVTDDKGNSWTLGASVTDTTHGTISAIYYALNAAPGTTVVHVNVTGHNADFVSAVVSEFNNVATASALDGSSGKFATSTSITSGSFTTSTPGDLIYQYASGDSGSGTSWSPGSAPWNLLSADYSGSQAAQYQVQASAGAINPTLAISPSTGWGSVAIALKSASSGTTLPSGIRVLRLVHINTTDETSGTVKFQFPTLSGNLIVMAFSSGVYYPTSIKDSKNNTYTYTGGVLTSDPCIKIFHAASATGDPALVVTATMTGNVPTGGGGTFFAYEIVGAAPNPLDMGFAAAGFAGANGKQDEVAGSGPVSTFTATPSGQNELVIVVGSMAADSATGWSNPSGAQQIATTFSGEPNPTNADENNPAGLFYNRTNTAAQTWSFTHDTVNHPGVGSWAVGGAAFQAPASGVTPPTTPANLTATAVSSSQINLSWTASIDPAGITGYVIELCQGAGCTSFGRVATSVGTATTFNDTGLSASGTYSYRVWATDSAGNASGYSNVATATTLSTVPTFTPPTSLTAAAASNVQINLSWAPATETGGTLTNYLIERCVNAACSNFLQVGTSATTIFTDTGLLASTSYSYRVRATDGTNFSTYSNTSSATTLASAPTPPSNLTATALGPVQINLSWMASTETGGTIANYLIERCSGAGCSTFASIATIAATTFSDTAGLLGSTGYGYRVRAIDTVNVKGPYSNTASAITAAPTFVAPSNLTATASGSAQINLSWTAATETGGTITNYLIERCTSSGCSNFAQVGTSATTTFSDTGVLASTSYSYRIIATDAAGNRSSPSSVSSATTLAGMPAAPSGLAATAASSSQINLSWTNNATNQTGFKVERSPDNVSFTQIGLTGSTTTNYYYSPLPPATLSYLRVRATNGAGDSAYSNVASATTLADTIPPTASSNLAAIAASGTQINLTWTASSDNIGVTQYQVQRCQGAGCTSFAQVGTSTTPSFPDTGLLAATSYSYQVRALDAANNASAFSNIATTATQSAAPPPLVTLVQHTETSVLSGTSTISQTFPAASLSGNLIIVSVKWGNLALSVSSVADNKGNVYTSAVGPTNWSGTLKSAQTFYAKNIVGGGAPITITVTLTGNSTSSFHLYQFEYTNIDPVNPIDTTCAAAGVGTAITCGPVATNFANDLLYAVAFNGSAVTNAGAGFTTLSTWHSNLVESLQTAAAGPYTGTASNASSTSWFIQLLAIKRHR